MFTVNRVVTLGAVTGMLVITAPAAIASAAPATTRAAMVQDYGHHPGGGFGDHGGRPGPGGDHGGRPGDHGGRPGPGRGW
jgi:hypothetical protein